VYGKPRLPPVHKYSLHNAAAPLHIKEALGIYREPIPRTGFQEQEEEEEPE